MLFDIGLHERALWDHLQPFRPHLVERAFYQLRADALAAQFRRHFGMDEGDDAVGDLVIGRGEMAVDGEFVAVMGPVVDDVAHGIWSPLLLQFFKDSVSMPRIDHASPSLLPL